MAESIPDSIWIRGEGGVVTKHDLPLHPAIEDRLRKGYLVRVANAAGDQYDPEADSLEVAAPPEERPDVKASKAVWVGWAVAESARRGEPITPDQAEAATKQDLIEKYGLSPSQPAE